MSKSLIELSYKKKIATLTLNHPKVLNAIGASMLGSLNDAVREIRSKRTDVRCLFITGAGRAFCAGANLADDSRSSDPNRTNGDALRELYHPLLCTLRDLEMPIVTAVNGVAAGIGMSLALMGDIVCVARSAYFLQAFARIGLIPDGGSTFVLPRLIGWGRAMELSMLAERLPAEKALDWGLINHVFDDEELLSQSYEIAGRLAKGPRSLAIIRKAYWQSWSNTYESQLDLEARLQIEAGDTADAREGVKAFLEKREPKFSGR